MILPLLKAFREKDVLGWRREISEAISEHAVVRFHERKRVVFHQGMASETVYAIKSGVVEIAGLNAAGLEMTSSIRGAGEPFGWSECLLDIPRSRQATVLQDAQLWEMGASAFLELLIARPNLMLAALGSAVHREAQTNGMRSDLRGTSAYNRVRYVLHQLARSAADEGSGGPRLRITHEEISRICELSRQTVTTILGELQRKGVVELGLRSIHVLNPSHLERAAESE
jgi:CRP/FNR family transcriptional regulator